MANLKGGERSRYVQRMFSHIASRYELMNRLMTIGQDDDWRKQVICLADVPEGGRLLDLGTGTGDIAREALHNCRPCRVVAADFTLEMMRVGRQIHDANNGHAPYNHNEAGVEPLWTAADAIHLPWPENTFDAVVSGFLMRNVSDMVRALNEQYRILKPGGKIVILDTSPPPNNFLAPVIRFYLHSVIPTLGKLVAGETEAYTYLPDSTENFLEPEKLAARLIVTGFKDVSFERLMMGTIAIHWGQK